jgi:protein-S-isoprenylcysteine O-methyltransferase Ste14
MNQMEKLSFYGIGPKIARIVLPWLAVTIALTLVYKNAFNYSEAASRILFYAGLALLILGLALYFSTIPLLLKGLKETKLVSKGAYYLCCNPLYASLILFIIPGISLMMNSWLIITTSVAGYIVFKIVIRGEYAEMEKFFGDEYRKYREVTPEFFPFPVKKWFN